MTAYELARPLLFALEPETAHRAGLYLARFVVSRVPACPVRAMGLDFPNPVGLAAGLDKDAAHVDALARLGFGFIELGTVTPRPQPGNPAPRLFRLREANALINRLGFNSAGVDAFMRNLSRARWRGIVGINIGRNADTPPERAIADYEHCLERVYQKASYVTINISSPNTQGLRALQERENLETLLQRLSTLRQKLSDRYGRRVPLALKISPDLDWNQVREISEAISRHRIDAVIATNTSVGREGIQHLPQAAEAGGLSGPPIRAAATRVLQELNTCVKGAATLIGAGGIFGADDVREKIAAGAKLVQLYTGLVYRGPKLVSECVSAFRAK